jgi:cysteine desulfurase
VHYLDHAATTPMRPEVWEAMRPYALDVFGNASGSHAIARAARNALEEARERCAALIGARPNEVVFTSGGTESDNLAVQGVVLAEDDGGLVTTGIEHEAVLETAAFLESLGREVTLVDPEANGVIEPAAIELAMSRSTALVSVMLANNETGILQPVADLAARFRSKGIDVPIHTDAVQAFGSERIDVDRLGVDLLSIAGHKVGGPKGIGLLYARSGIRPESVLHGGGQEQGRRPGTVNVMGAVGLAVAMERTVDDRSRFTRRVGAERDAFEAALRVGLPSIAVTGTDLDRLPSHSHVRIPGIDQQTALIRLDRAGVAASAGSACSSGAANTSHVLLAMGMGTTEARTALRFSFGWTTKVGEGAEAASVVIDAVGGPR